MATFNDATWDDIEALRGRVAASLMDSASVEAAAQTFVELFAATFDTLVLARLFVVVTFGRLAPNEQAWARAFAADAGREAQLGDATPILLLLGTTGIEPAWRDRERSREHVAIPLFDAAFVAGVPMLASFLEALEIELPAADDRARAEVAPVSIRRLPGGINGRFYVGDAQTARDALDRPIIATDFVARYGVRTVFGMGGPYVEDTVAAAIFFTREALPLLVVDRFPSFVSSFKMSTARLVSARKLMR